MITEMPSVVMELLHTRFTVLEHMRFLDFDHDFNRLRARLNQCRKPCYAPEDRIIVEHLDTDYYFDHCAVGVNLRNFFGVVHELDIPYSSLVLYTNHFGIAREIDLLCAGADRVDRPMIIESFLGNLHHQPDQIHAIEPDLDHVSHHAVCMMHCTRSHRHAVYNALNHISADVLMLSATVPDAAI